MEALWFILKSGSTAHITYTKEANAAGIQSVTRYKALIQSYYKIPVRNQN